MKTLDAVLGGRDGGAWCHLLSISWMFNSREFAVLILIVLSTYLQDRGDGSQRWRGGSFARGADGRRIGVADAGRRRLLLQNGDPDKVQLDKRLRQ